MGGIRRASLSGCQMDKTSGRVVLCPQEGSFQVWAKVVSYLFSLFSFSLSTPTNSPELGCRDTQNWRIRKGG